MVNNRHDAKLALVVGPETLPKPYLVVERVTISIWSDFS